MPLSEKEKEELAELDNPEVKSLSSAWNPVFSIFTDSISDLRKRKKRVVKLRTKMRLEELGLDADRDYQMYYQICGEEEKRFDKRFNNSEIIKSKKEEAVKKENKQKQIKENGIKTQKTQGEKLETSQKVAAFGTICLFASLFFFFIYWPIGVILFILAIISTGAFYGFQNTEKADNIKEMKENLEKREKPSLCPHCGKYHEGHPNFCPNCGGKL